MHPGAVKSPQQWLRQRVDRNRGQEAVGLFSVCSAHPQVLEAAMRQVLDDESMLCVESTSNQVNQFGGYTGLTPAQFAEYLASIAGRVGFAKDRIVLGGDHLGPYPWRSQPSQAAMEKAAGLVRGCVLAGYVKIHLDASMGCADDHAGPLADEVVAQRAALLCKAAETAHGEQPRNAPAPLYVIGTEVPVPGGEQAAARGPEVTKIENLQNTLAVTRAAFLTRGLEEAWERVIGLVVQPGVEFGDTTVFDYDRRKAHLLSKNLPGTPSLVYEAHSTDYQKPAALREMVADHFAILKVGPWLTFAFREAIFALSTIEQEWLGERRGIRISRVRQVLEEAMLRNPAHWKSYYSGEEPERHFARQYSYSDRCRYFWPEALVQKELELLVANLSSREIPLTLLSQYLPQQYAAVRAGAILAQPAALVEHRIRQVLESYSSATCG